MTILNFIVQLMSGAMLLLFSVRFMRIGIERLWSAEIRDSLSDRSSHLQNLAKGTVLGFVMQGGTVVMLMAAGLAGTGAVPLVSAAVLALGADLGSALAVRFLHLPIAALGPLAILIGATVYLRSDKPRLRNLGRVVLGLGLILLSLSIIRGTVEPISSLDGVAAAVDYLNRDVVTAALAGIVLTFVMHSSVAAVLTAVAFAAHSDIGAMGALGFMLGCNIGSALLPLWLLNSHNERTKAVAASVAILRVGFAAVLIGVIALSRDAVEARVGWHADEAMLLGHLLFNAALLALTPICVWLCATLERRLVTTSDAEDATLTLGVTEEDGLALPALKRKLSGMLDLAAKMLDEVMRGAHDPQRLDDLEARMNGALEQIRQFYATVPGGDGADLHEMSQVLHYAIRVERCGDILAGRLHALRVEQAGAGVTFSAPGLEEIEELAGALRQTLLLAHNAIWTGDAATAERLVRHKQRVSDLETASRANHLDRLRGGNLVSLSSSDHHLETIASLKEVNSKLATIGYAILDRAGGLKKTRLKSGARP